jgi:outer membrane murein-binding lipoprotein Lpp
LKANKTLSVAILALVVLAGAFWMLLISPKREEASTLGQKVDQLESSLAEHEAEAAAAQAAREEFPTNYSQLVVLGKAAPADAETASLLVQIQQIAQSSHVRFEEISLDGSGEGAVAPAPEATAEASPTEVAASTMPLGATSTSPATSSRSPTSSTDSTAWCGRRT